MQPTTCPICSKRNPAGDLRCLKCGADFTDPDVLAMAPGDSTEMPQATLGEIGQLSSDKFIGVSRTRLLEGGALRTIAFLGGVGLLVAFLIPIPQDPIKGSWWMAWSVGGQHASWAFWYPLLAGIAGIALAYVPKPERWIRAIIMAAVSLFGLFFIAPRLARAGMGFTSMMPLFTLGLLGAACAMALRVYFPLEQAPRLAIIVAAALTLIGMLIPLADANAALPLEFTKFTGHDWQSTSLAGVAYTCRKLDMLVRMLGIYMLLPMVLFIGAAAASWPVPGGVWDKTSFIVRPFAWFVVLYLPLQKTLLVFNATGWSETRYGMKVANETAKLSTAIMLSRTRMILVATVFTLWAVFSAVVIYKHFRPHAGAAAATTKVG